MAQAFHCILCKKVYLYFTNNFAYQKKKKAAKSDSRYQKHTH